MRLLPLLVGLLASAVNADPFTDWLAIERKTAVRKMLGAIGSNGSVVAAPTEHTPGQNYYFFWVRDGALVMGEVARLTAAFPAGPQKTQFQELLDNYVTFCDKVQTSPQPKDPLFKGLGEPKFFIDGMVFQSAEKWKSPQDDGPALRLLSMLDVLRSGQPKSARIDTIIQRDLGYLKAHVADPNAVDLWEEIRGRHYFNQRMQHQALLEASAHLPSQAPSLQPAIDRLEQELKKHHQGNLIHSSLEDLERLDSSVLLAALYAQRQGPDTPLLDPDLMATFWKMRQSFQQEYKINQKITQDSEGIALEPGLGRYPGDFYDGSEGNPPGHPHPTYANPWFLITAGAAEYCYRLQHLLQTQSIAVDERTRPLLECAAGHGLPGGVLTPKDRSAVAAGLGRLGDAYLRRVRHHAGADGSMSEQFHRETGVMTGATSLTWNYAAILRAIDQRH